MTAPGVVIKCDLLGALGIKQKDPDGTEMRNDRYIFCPHKEDSLDEPVVADCVPEHLRREIEQFFFSSVLGTGKKLKLKGWQNAEQAATSQKGDESFPSTPTALGAASPAPQLSGFVRNHSSSHDVLLIEHARP